MSKKRSYTLEKCLILILLNSGVARIFMGGGGGGGGGGGFFTMPTLWPCVLKFLSKKATVASFSSILAQKYKEKHNMTKSVLRLRNFSTVDPHSSKRNGTDVISDM